MKNLDAYFSENYCDYVRLAAIEGYSIPDMLVIGADGNISRKDEKWMRLCHQEKGEELLARFKQGLEDTYFTFHFSCISIFRRIKNVFRKDTFARLLPKALAHCQETVLSAGEKLTIDAKIWNAIVKGKVYPEKCTVLALAFACRMNIDDVNALLYSCGFVLENSNVRDIVVGYLLQQKIFNPTMRDKCLAEYKISSLPIAKEEQNA